MYRKKDIILLIFKILFKRYSSQGWWPVFDLTKNVSVYRKKKYLPEKKEIFEISVGAILTQNTSWKNAEKALGELKKNGYLTPFKIVNSENEKLYEMIRSSGYFRQKAEKLKIFSLWFLNNEKDMFKKDPIDLRNDLLKLKGVGKETADSIVLYAFGGKIFVIDSYTRRIYYRITGDWKKYEYDDLRKIFENNLPSELKIYNEFHALIVKLAKEICQKRNPLCEKCPLKKVCQFKRRKDERNRNKNREILGTRKH